MKLPDDVVVDPEAEEAFAVARTYRKRFPRADVETIGAFFSLSLTMNAALAVSDRFFARFGHGLNSARYSLLRSLYLAEEKQRPLNEIAKELGVTAPNITYLLQTLEKEGLAEKVPSKRDRRVFYAHLTPAGEALCDALLPATLAFLDELGAALSSEEKNQLTVLLSRVRRRVEQMANADD